MKDAKRLNTKRFNIHGIDKIILHKVFGFPVFLGLMYCVFGLTIQVGGMIQQRLSTILYKLFIHDLNQVLELISTPHWIKTLLVSGVGQGFYTTLSFFPIIMIMFFCLGVLDTSGYMARATIVMDKIMSWVGLSGKSFMPMVLGFGCNVPAILGTRTLENPRERILTILMTPFMSCGARLAIYALFVAAFFPTGGHNIIFALYVIGIVVAFLTGLGLKRIILDRNQPSLKMELPHYRWPNIGILLRNAWHRSYDFVYKAGMVIVPLCVIIGSLGNLKTTHNETWLNVMGQYMTPIFAPMGLKEDNWPATVGLLTGILAKEVAVGTLTALYLQEGQERQQEKQGQQQQQLKQKGQQPVNPLGVMAERFGSREAAFAYLLFVLLYFPCVSVLATMARELNLSWALFSALWTTGIAYIVSVMFYQLCTFAAHPISSFLWIVGGGISASLGFWRMQKWVREAIKKDLNKNANNKYKMLPTPIVVLHQK